MLPIPWRIFLPILLGFVTAPASAADEHAGHPVLGTVHFPVTCTPEAQQAFDEAMKLQHSFWYQAAHDAFSDVLQRDPECAMAYWGDRHDPAHQSVLAAARAEPGRRLGGAGAGAAARRQERARGRLHRRALGVLPRCRDQGSSHAGPRVRAGDGAAPRPLSGRSRGRDLLCARAQRRRAADRQDLRQAARGGRDPGGGGRAPAGPSGRGALPDPYLRLPAAGRPRARGGRPLRRARRLGAARAPHAVAHLHAARPSGTARSRPTAARPRWRAPARR